MRIIKTRQESSMIHSVRPTVQPVAIVWFCDILKSGDGRTDGRTDDMCKNQNSDHIRL